MLSSPRRHADRFAHWFWRGLTALVFAGVLALCLTPPVEAASPGFDGVWRIELEHPGGPLPFGLEVHSGKGKPAVFLLNPPERLRAERASIAGNVLTLEFPSYRSSLRLELGRDGRLTGTADFIRRAGPVSLAARGSRGSWRFSPSPARPAADLSGRWLVQSGTARGVAILRQTGNRVTGAVQFPSGDTRYLAGELSGRDLALSHFDGSATALWRARLEGGRLAGEQFFANSPAGSAWSATRLAGPAAAQPEAVAVEAPASDRLAFRFPDSRGRMVSLADARYRGKVVVITLGGAWCPNCHDEARFLAAYARAHAARGVEIIGLNFEYGDDPARAFRQIDSFGARYNIPYPLLLAGQPTPESTKAALGALGPVKVYPSTIFIGRDGGVREVHVGWAGPATGPLNARAKRDFDATVQRLLREKI